MIRWRTLLTQSVILIASLGAVALQVWNFPFPSPVISPFLAPNQRWPEAQIKQWVENDSYDPAFVHFFMRDPERTIPPGDNLVSPADGVIKEVIQAPDKIYFVVGLGFWDVHVVRSPVEGTVIDLAEEGIAFFRDVGESVDTAYLKGKAGPVQKIVTIRSAQGEYKVRLITSWWASRLKVSARIGQHIAKGERIGRILLGSTVVVDAPPDTHFTPSIGTRVVAGETIVSDLGDAP